ncbi:MAG: M23 family metallopeptidase [Betaproteobacteria bacterium]|nr:M23 family metallopeptidase [Betaproteobacteria bacterium]NBY06124.1 M23 family metallopeptidase [Betaproteobacteria bacterium]
MQFMWVSGPTGTVKSISITARKVILTTAGVSLALMLVGFVMYFVGFRIAVEFSPDLARSMGGVTTEAEQQRMEAVYRERLDQLRQNLHATSQEIKQLESLKNRFMELATPTQLRDRFLNNGKKDEGRGGPLLPSPLRNLFFPQTLDQELNGTLQELLRMDAMVRELRQDWTQHLEWLHSLPTGLPIQGDFRVSSGFGIRNDPFTGLLAMHEGLDFTASTGTPVVAVAPGTVTRSAFEGSYGQVIEVTHAEGFMTRYAHLSRRHVVEGQLVERGTHLGDVGSTGRSTGPHLHYEVYRRDRPINPMQVLPINAS